MDEQLPGFPSLPTSQSLSCPQTWHPPSLQLLHAQPLQHSPDPTSPPPLQRPKPPFLGITVHLSLEDPVLIASGSPQPIHPAVSPVASADRDGLFPLFLPVSSSAPLRGFFLHTTRLLPKSQSSQLSLLCPAGVSMLDCPAGAQRTARRSHHA